MNAEFCPSAGEAPAGARAAPIVMRVPAVTTAAAGHSRERLLPGGRRNLDDMYAPSLPLFRTGVIRCHARSRSHRARAVYSLLGHRTSNARKDHGLLRYGPHGREGLPATKTVTIPL